TNDQVAILIVSGQLQPAKELLAKATRMTMKHLGVENETMTRCLHNTATIEHELGNLDKALAIARQALVLERKVLPRDHETTAKTLVEIARIQIQKGQYPLAATEALLKEAVGMNRRLYGPQSVKVAWVRYHLGLLYFYAGKIDQARSELETALSIY